VQRASEQRRQHEISRLAHRKSSSHGGHYR
jgi:hypothetical protein